MKRFIKRRSVFLPLLCLSLVSTLLLSACNNQNRSSTNSQSKEDTLRLLYWQAPTILNPYLSNGSKDLEASRISLEPLASFNNDAELIPILAAEIPSRENGGVGSDGKSVTWKLKPDLKWSDGTPLTADDLVFTYKYIVNPEVATFAKGIYEVIQDVKAIDDRTVKIEFKEVNPAWFRFFVGQQGPILPKHIFEKYNGPNAREAPANLKPVGTGPYQVVEFKPGDTVIYEPNPNFREPDKLSFKRVELKGGGDATSAARAVLQTGEADYAYNLQVEAQVLKQLEASGKGKIVSNLGAYMERILVNHTDPNRATADGERSSIKFPHPFFSDRKVRQAFSLAVNSKIVAEELYGVTGKPTSNILVVPPQYYSPNTSSEFDLQKAAALLDEAGWKDSNGDRIRDKNGVEMKVLFQTSVNPLRQKTQQIIKRDLESIGIGVELKAIDAQIFFSSDPASNDTVEHFYADLQMFSRQSSSPDPADYMKIFTCDQIPQKANSWVGNNATRYCNPKYDDFWKKATKELDPDKRREMFIKMNDMLVDDVAIIPMIHRADVIAISNNLKGIEMTAWDTRTWNIMDWKRN
ncbi:MAG: peptide ABC transporter substrate-binding protein [Prochloraceae cyanobacterium]|nr:peptide ABC transporter substrate-binding protein [Prochloraceae cyanobacterium]